MKHLKFLKALLDDPALDNEEKVLRGADYRAVLSADAGRAEIEEFLRQVMNKSLYYQDRSVGMIDWFELCPYILDLWREFLANPTSDFERLSSWKRYQQEFEKRDAFLRRYRGLRFSYLRGPGEAKPDYLADFKGTLDDSSLSPEAKVLRGYEYGSVILHDQSSTKEEQALRRLLGLTDYYRSRSVPVQYWAELCPYILDIWRAFLASPSQNIESLAGWKPYREAQKKLEARWLADGTFTEDDFRRWAEPGY